MAFDLEIGQVTQIILILYLMREESSREIINSKYGSFSTTCTEKQNFIFIQSGLK